MIKLVFFAGSSRSDSLNKRLAKAAATAAKSATRGVPNGPEVETTFIDLADFDIPMFNGDLEHELGKPVDVVKLKAMLADCDGIFIASPEYNGAYTGLLKNTVDWMSRNIGGQEITPFKDATIAICSASPGPRGGLASLSPLRLLLSHIGSMVIPSQAAFGGATFNDDGSLKDEKQQKLLDAVLTNLIKTAKALKS
ncbi:MAG: NAD(P)H-dependent oxidoreductase [Rhizobiales bacterium]|nr:NAD(P)H-dependent oxidoreductase [Hyphomicrobiales bacterium]NRB13723.1 NAD(P)H-dependent oxidoreductase [Hyphomicrobiales bacterium]